MAFFRCVMVESTHVCNFIVSDLPSDLDFYYANFSVLKECSGEPGLKL